MKKNILAALLAVVVSLPAYALTEGKDYELMKVEVAPLQKDKIEVTEFFAYWCPHCYDLEPVIAKHVKTFASDTVYRPEHIVWDNGRDMGLARLAAAVKQSGLRTQANQAIFDAVVKNKINLGEPQILAQWVNSQNKFDGKKLMAAYESFSNPTMAKQMADWTAQYGIEGTPTVVVGGKYKLLFPNGFEVGMKTIDELVEKVRAERGMKAPAPKIPAKSVANRFVKAANH